MTVLINEVERKNEFKGVHVCRDSPSVSDLLFVDDSLILMKADSKNAIVLRNIINRYCAASCQVVSEANSSIYFSLNTKVSTKAGVCQILNILTESLSHKYLGLPLMVGLNRSDCLMHLVDRLCQMVNG